MPETLASYRKRVAELTKGKANYSGLCDDRRRSHLAGTGSAGIAAPVALITRIVSHMNCGPLPEEWTAITRFSALSSTTHALAH
jgi:hypothetical protein